MNNNIEIDTDKLSVEIEKMKKVKKDLEDIFTNVETETTELKDYWSSKTAESVQEDFKGFYKNLEKAKNNLSSDISFLETLVNKHIEEENKENKKIDERIAV